jgi:hypothetical protein
VAFEARDEGGRPIYHTNVMLGIGSQWAVACLAAIEDSDQRRRVADRLSQTRELIAISQRQVAELCGNVLELRSRSGAALLAVSERAWAAFTPGQRAALERHARPVAVGIPTIEAVGGGGIRCLLAEIFLTRRGSGPRGPGV